jgi:L-ascorbate metabolism protein UlaG (beta-lactamase superfamily)
MEITYFAHSSFKIKTKLATIVIDPFDPDMVGIKFPKVSADIVCVTHNHNDHNRVDLVKDVKKVINAPGEYEVSGVSIFGFSSFHDNKKGEERGKNTIYSIEVEDLCVVHLGDLGHTLPQNMIETLGEVDVLMIPVGGHVTIGSSEAVEVVKSIEPKVVVPMHYDIPSLNKDIFKDLSPVDVFLRELALPVSTEAKLVVKGPIIEEQKVVVLKPINV